MAISPATISAAPARRSVTVTGAHIKLMDHSTILIEGVRELYGAPVTVTDLRAGAALIVAGLMAKGVTEIYETSYIDRGYERIEEKLRSLGADIRREKLS